MKEKKRSIFRKQSLERVSSPEELDSYLMVTGPGIWMTLIAVIVLLLGVFAWMIFGHLDTTVDVAVVCKDGEAVCLLPAEQYKGAASVTIADKTYPLQDVDFSVIKVTSDMDPNLLEAGGLEVGDSVLPMELDANLQDGIYQGVATTETVQPIRFIIN